MAPLANQDAWLVGPLLVEDVRKAEDTHNPNCRNREIFDKQRAHETRGNSSSERQERRPTQVRCSSNGKKQEKNKKKCKCDVNSGATQSVVCQVRTILDKRQRACASKEQSC